MQQTTQNNIKNFSETEIKVDRRKTMPHLFKKGHSGNPGGRPKGAVSLITIMRDKLAQTSYDNKRTVGEHLVENLIQQALEGDMRAQTIVFNYLEGMPRQAMEISGEGGEPLNLGVQILSVINKIYGKSLSDGNHSNTST